MASQGGDAIARILCFYRKGTHKLSIISATTLVSGSSYTSKWQLEPLKHHRHSSSALGIGLEVGIAGEES